MKPNDKFFTDLKKAEQGYDREILPAKKRWLRRQRRIGIALKKGKYNEK